MRRKHIRGNHLFVVSAIKYLNQSGQPLGEASLLPVFFNYSSVLTIEYLPLLM